MQQMAPSSPGDNPSPHQSRHGTGPCLGAIGTLTLPAPTCWARSWLCPCSLSLCKLCSCSSTWARWASASSRLPRSSSRSWSRLSSCCSRARCLDCRD